MPLSVSVWTDRSDPVFDGVGLANFPTLLFFLSPRVFSFHSFNGLVVCGSGLLIDRVFSLSLSITLLT